MAQVSCGKERHTSPPHCSMRCRTKPLCHHKHSQPHTCHFGACPACTLPCKQPLPKCTHICSAPCKLNIYYYYYYYYLLLLLLLLFIIIIIIIYYYYLFIIIIYYYYMQATSSQLHTHMFGAL